MRLIVFLGLLLSIGCGSTKFVKTGTAATSKAPTCEFDILTDENSKSFREIGVVKVDPGAGGANTFKDIASFKEEIRPHVCRAGGDAVIANANVYGYYTEAVVIKKVTEAAGALP